MIWTCLYVWQSYSLPCVACRIRKHTPLVPTQRNFQVTRLMHYKTSQTLGMAVASLTHVRYYTDRLTGFACFSWKPCSYNTHDYTKTNHPPRVHYTKRIYSKLFALHSAHVPTTVHGRSVVKRCYTSSINDNIYRPAICVTRRPTKM
jgi:hypothetical protein